MELYRIIRKLERELKACDDLGGDAVIERRREIVEKKLSVIRSLIDQIDDVELRHIFGDRYLAGMTWEDIGRKYGYSLSSLYRLRLRGLLAIIG